MEKDYLFEAEKHEAERRQSWANGFLWGVALSAVGVILGLATNVILNWFPSWK